MTEGVEQSVPVMLSACRTQEVEGFRYLYLEQRHVAEWEVGDAMRVLMPRIFELYAETFGAAEPPPLMAMFIDLEEKTYDVRVGFPVRPETPALAGALEMAVPPSLCAGVLVWGADVTVSYAPLMDYVNALGLTCVDGWRETYVHWSGETSPNNISLIQHVVEES
jgi:hypothetical protein